MKNQKTFYDVIICGAGISGLYCAMRLAEHNDVNQAPKKIGLIEQSNRIGGRIYTEFMDQAPGIPVELGAMRFLDSHIIVKSLVNRYRLQKSAFGVDEHKKFHLRGLLHNENCNDFPRFNLRPSETGKNPEELLAYAINRVIPRSMWKDLNQVFKKRDVRFSNDVYDDISVNDFGFQSLLQSLISNEAFELVKKTTGYDSTFFNWNALQAIRQIVNDLSSKTRSWQLNQGMSQLSENLLKDFVQFGGNVCLGSKIIKIELKNHSKNQFIECEVATTDGKSFTLGTKQLILAVPADALRPLLISPELNNHQEVELKNRLNAVYPQPGFKLFLAFNEPWWRTKDFRSGSIVSDSPLRMTYFSKTSEECGGSKGDTRCLALASYADMESFYFWNSYRTKGGYQPSPETAPIEMQGIARHFLSEIFNKSIPAPIASTYKLWSTITGCAAYHAWQPGINVSRTIEEMQQPFQGKPIFVVGEAFSPLQCWIEGALMTSESVLQKYFSLEPVPRLSEEQEDFDKLEAA